MKKLFALVLAFTMLLSVLPAMAEAPMELIVPEELALEAFEAEPISEIEMIQELLAVEEIEVPEEEQPVAIELVPEPEEEFEFIPEEIETIVIPEAEEPVVYDLPGEIEAAFGSTYNGNIAGAGYIYYYKLTVPTPGYVSVLVNSQIPSLDTAIYDSSLTLKYMESNGFGNGSGLHIMKNWFTAGTYYVRVGYAGALGAFTFNATFTSANATIVGAVTAREAATMTANGSVITGVFCMNDAEDYLVLNVTSSGRLEVKFSADLDGAPLSATMENAVTGTVVGNVYTIGGSVTMQSWLMPGSYLLHVTNAGSSDYGRYTAIPTFTTINVTDREPNDGRGTAMAINAAAATVSGMVSMEDAYDCFSFTLTTPAWLNLTVNACMDALNVELYDSELLTVLADDNRTGTGGNVLSPYPHSIRHRLNPGTYYIRISRSGTVCGNYTMNVQTSLTYTSLIASTNPVELGNSVTFTATYVGTEVIQQRVWTVRDDANNVLYTTSANNSDTFIYTPSTVGKFTVTLQAYDGTNWDYITSDMISCQQTPVLNISSISVSGVQKVGEKITATVNTVGGNGVSMVNWNVFYAPDYVHSDYLISQTTGSTSADFIFSGSGAYALYVSVCDAKTGVWVSAWSNWFNVAPADYFQILSVSLSATSIPLNSSVTANVSFSGKPTFIQYDVYDDKDVRVASVNGTNTTYTFAPSKTGSYHIWVSAWNGSSWSHASSSWFTVYNPASPVNIISFTPSSTAITLGETVKFELTTTGSKPVATEYTVYDQYDNVVYTWTGNSDYMEFGPNAVGSYYCTIRVFDGVTYQTRTTGMVGVSSGGMSAFTASISGISATYAAGDPVNFTLTITGTHPLVNAHYYICEVDPATTTVWQWEGNATDITGWSWTAGHYRVYAEVYNGLEWINTSSDWFDIT